DADDDGACSDAKPNQSEQALRGDALHRNCRRRQAADPASPGSVECSPPAASSDVSSVVSSSMIPMMRSASAGAIPGSFSKSSRSRSMISLSVRNPASSSTATVAGGKPVISEGPPPPISSDSSGKGAKSGDPTPRSSHSRLEY